MIDGIVAAHEARLHGLDSLLPRRHPLPEPLSGETPIVVDGGVGYARRIAVDVDSPAADWSALDEHRLGYRPLWSWWAVAPASRLRTGVVR